MLFKKSQKRFNYGDGKTLDKKNIPCTFTKNVSTVNCKFSLKNNMTFCMIPKPRCSNCN